MAHADFDQTPPGLLDLLLETGVPGADGHPTGWFSSSTRHLDAVRRDLTWLLKTDAARPENVVLANSTEPGVVRGQSRSSGRTQARTLADFKFASRSVLGYGIPLFRGEQETRSSGTELARAVEAAIRLYEPRIDPGTLKVRFASKKVGDPGEGGISVFGFEIEGQVRMRPVPEHLVIQAYYTPAFAHWRIERVGHGG